MQMSKFFPLRKSAQAHSDNVINTLMDMAAIRKKEEELAEAREDLSRQLINMHRLHKLALELTDVRELRPAIQSILQTLVDLQEAKYGIVILYDETSKELYEIANVGFNREFINVCAHFQTEEHLALCGNAFAEGQRVVVEDTETDLRFTAFRHISVQMGFRAVHTTPICSSDGKVLGMMSTHFEEPHAPSQQEIQMADMCSCKVSQVIKNIQIQQALLQGDKKKDEFLAVLAHELRNPLAPIKNGLTVLRAAENRSDISREVREMMERQVDHMVHLINDLMDISRITRGKIELDCQRVRMSDVINNAIEIVRPLIEESGHSLTINYSSKAIFVIGDTVRLSQIFANLLNNAAKYMNDNGKIEINVETKDNMAVIQIRDEGIGITAKALPTIFDMFTQSDNLLNRKRGGLGIGLNLVRNLVQMHGGNIMAHSEGLNKGSIFTVRLPTDEKYQVNKSVNDKTLDSPAPVRILIIDDNFEAARTLGWALEMYGHEVKYDLSGRKGIDTARDFMPQVVLMDIGMPEMNGYETCQIMREIPGLEKTVFIAQTGWGQDADRERSRSAGFAHHLVKPVEISTLQETVLAAIKPD
jgi:CheY-like chemotaxis protein